MSIDKEVVIRKNEFKEELDWDYFVESVDLVDQYMDQPFDSVFLQVSVATPRR